MAVFRINKSKNYTVMSNYHLKDKKLSLKAKGLLSIMLSLPDEWDYSINGLIKISKEGERAIKSTLQELKTNKYLTVTKLYPNQTESKKIEYIYDIFENPKKENQGVHFVGVENVSVQNAGQLNTKKLNTKNKKKNIKEKSNFEQRTYENKDLEKLYINKML